MRQNGDFSCVYGSKTMGRSKNDTHVANRIVWAERIIMARHDSGLGLRSNGQAGAPVVGVERTQIGSAADVRQRGIRETDTKAAAKQKVSGIPNFKDNPLGAIGLILQEVAAGAAGAPSPVAAANRQAIEEQSFQLRKDAQTLNAIKFGVEQLEAFPEADSGALVATITKISPEAGAVLSEMSKAAVEKSRALLDLFDQNPEMFPGAAKLARLVGVEKAVDIYGGIAAEVVKQGALAPGKDEAAQNQADREVQTALAKQEALAPGANEAARAEARLAVATALAKQQALRSGNISETVAIAEALRPSLERISAEANARRPNIDRLKAEADAIRSSIKRVTAEAEARRPSIERVGAEAEARRPSIERIEAEAQAALKSLERISAEAAARRPNIDRIRAESEAVLKSLDRLVAEQTALAPVRVAEAGLTAAAKRQTPQEQAAVVSAKEEARLRVQGGGEIQRRITKSADGFFRYDDGTRVFPGVEKAEQQGSRRFQNLGAYVDQKTGEFVGEVTFDTRNSERTINIGGKEQPVPAGVIPITESNLHKNAMTGEQFFQLATEIQDTERGLRELTRFMTDAKDTRQGWQLLADQFLGHMNTIFGNELSEEQFKTFASTGRLQGLLGAYRKEVVGGGVMTEQDALRVIARLGGDFNLTRNREVAAALIRELMEEKLSRFNNLLLPMFNGQLTTVDRRGFTEKKIIEIDESVFSISESKIPPPPPGAVID